MANNTTKQKEIEEKCLSDIIATLRKKEKLTGVESKVLGALTGSVVNREINEHPDFVFRQKQNQKSDLLWGVEHFRVHQQSIGNEFENSIGFSKIKRISSIFNRWGEIVRKSGGIPADHREPILTDIGNELSFEFDLKMRCSCVSFVGSLQRATEQHYKKIDSYYQNLHDVNDDNYKTQIIFIAETYSCLDDMYTEQNGSGHIEQLQTIPITEEIVNIVESMESKKVCYFVLCNYTLNKETGSSNPTVYVLPTKNTRNYLKQINVPVFKYIGFDNFAPEIHQKIMQNDKITIDTTKKLTVKLDTVCEFDDETIQCAFEIACLLRKYSKQGFPLLTSTSLGLCYYVFRNLQWSVGFPHHPIIRPNKDLIMLACRMYNYDLCLQKAHNKSR